MQSGDADGSRRKRLPGLVISLLRASGADALVGGGTPLAPPPERREPNLQSVYKSLTTEEARGNYDSGMYSQAVQPELNRIRRHIR